MLSATAAYIAFNELDKALEHVGERSIGTDLPDECALFVTWTLGGDLRGCIGTFEPQPTESTIRKYALIAAFHDPRFDPISLKEFRNLSVTVTLLGPLEPTKDLYDWEIGVHGIRADFPDNKSSTFLPEVAQEQRWTKHKTLEMLARKASATSLDGMKIMRYEGHKSELEYRTYKSL